MFFFSFISVPSKERCRCSLFHSLSSRQQTNALNRYTLGQTLDIIHIHIRAQLPGGRGLEKAKLQARGYSASADRKKQKQNEIGGSKGQDKNKKEQTKKTKKTRLPKRKRREMISSMCLSRIHPYSMQSHYLGTISSRLFSLFSPCGVCLACWSVADIGHASVASSATAACAAALLACRCVHEVGERATLREDERMRRNTAWGKPRLRRAALTATGFAFLRELPSGRSLRGKHG